MQIDTSIIDRIVAGVLTQLGTGGEGARGHVTAETQRRGGSAEGVAIDANVVTADVLLECMKGESRILVTERAIVTPAAWDAARERGVEIIKQSPRVTPRGSATQRDPDHRLNGESHGALPVGLELLLIVVRGTNAVEQLGGDLAATWRRELNSNPDEAASCAISAICRGEASTIVIFVEQTHQTACLANRNEQVQAVAIVDPGDVRRVHSQFKANVWCVDPTGRSWFELRNLVRAISDN